MATLPGCPDFGPPAEDICSAAAIDLGSQQLTNYTGHSYLSRFLCFGLGGWIYKKQRHVVDRLLTEIATNMASLFETGITLKNGKTYFAALVAIKGDMDFHGKYWNLSRCYSNIGTVNNLQFCHRCFAGAQGYAAEIFSDEPPWLETVDVQRPWNVDCPPPLSLIPFDPSCPERALQGDIFHIFKTGMGRDLAGGVIVTLARKGFWDFPDSSTNFPDRLDRAHATFSMWCKAEGHCPGLRSFSKSYFNMVNLVSAPWTSSKGSDTMLLLRFCCFFLHLNINSPHVLGFEDLLQDMLEVCESAVNMTMIHSHGLWLSRPCATKLYWDMMVVLRGYAVLGRRAINLGVRAFIFKPKIHALHHLALSLRCSLQLGSPRVLSPQAFACEMNEDYIGRISRLSRRVGFRLVDLRVAERLFMKMFALLKRRKNPSLKPAKRGTLKRLKPKRSARIQ